MRVKIITSYPASWIPLANLTCATMQRYCAKWNYDLFRDCSERQEKKASPWVDDKDPDIGTYVPLRTMVKFPLLEHFLRSEDCQEQNDYVCWFDNDCVVTNYGIPVSKWFVGHDKDLVLAYDVNGVHPTIILVRNTPIMRGLMWACKEAGWRMYGMHGWSDIMAFRFMLDYPPYADRVKFFSAQEMCAMPPMVHPMPNDVRGMYEWSPDSWTVHLSALGLEHRVSIATQFIEQLGLLA